MENKKQILLNYKSLMQESLDEMEAQTNKLVESEQRSEIIMSIKKVQAFVNGLEESDL